MFIVDGVAHAGNPASPKKVTSVVSYGEYKLLLSFNDGEKRIFDFLPLLSQPAFQPLADQALFSKVVIDHGVPTWCDGDVDISPEYLYQEGLPLKRIS